MSLGRPGLTQDPTGPTFGDAQPTTDMQNRLSPPRRAQKFPEAASLKMAMSKAWFATNFFS